MTTPTDLPIVLFESQQAWEDWLEANHADAKGVWMKFAKKGKGVTSVTYAEALDSAICYGWIDGQVKKFDDRFYLQRFTPRRPKSVWSKINVEKVERLTKAKRMRPAGIRAVEAARDDGRWDAAYDSHSTLTVPEDFQAAIDKSPKAKRFFATLDKTNLYSYCFRVQTARKPETRRARIEKLVAKLEAGEKFHS